MSSEGYHREVHVPAYTPSTARENFLANIPTIRRAHPIRELRHAAPGELAVVVGAGPSLDQALPTLQRFFGLVIAVDRAAPTLMAHGIAPRFVVTQDNGIGNLGGFKTRFIPGASLIFHQCADSSYVRSWQGPVYTADLVGGRLGLGHLDWGPHVGHAAVALAHLMLCRPIVLVGVDLAFPAGSTHAGGVNDTVNCKRETTTPGVRGDQVDTDEGFATAVDELARFIRSTRAHVVQTSPWGARIPGAEEWDLRGLLIEKGALA